MAIIPLKTFRLENGIIGLSGGNVADRYCYFRSDSFQKYLDDNGLTTMAKFDGHVDATVRSCYHAGGHAAYAIMTDGKVDKDCWYDRDSSTDDGWVCCSSEYWTHITEVTWAVVATAEMTSNRHCKRVCLYMKDGKQMKLPEDAVEYLKKFRETSCNKIKIYE